MLALTKKTEYALIGLIYLCERPGQWVSARAIASVYGVPLPLLMNILKDLARSGIVTSERGSKGGYKLKIDPAMLSLADVIHSIEGPVNLTNCLTDQPPADLSKCSLRGECPIHRPLRKVHQRLHELLATVTLADLTATEPQDTPTPEDTLEDTVIPVEELVKC